jgi:hypothetical protein
MVQSVATDCSNFKKSDGNRKIEAFWAGFVLKEPLWDHPIK